MRAPKKFYFLEVINGTGRHLRHGERGGGHFTSEQAAIDRQNYIGAKGVESILYVSEANWDHHRTYLTPTSDDVDSAP